MDMLIELAGTVTCLYAETIALDTLGPMTIRRVSHVEPTSAGQWIADLHATGGPVLGPYHRRSEAIRAEEAWLNAHVLVAKKY